MTIEDKFRKYFAPHELVSYAHYQKLNGDPETIYALFSLRLKATAVYLRECFGVPALVNNWHNYLDELKFKTISDIEKEKCIDVFEFRGFRSDDCKIGAKHSEHRKGDALDITFRGFGALEARNLIRDRFIKELPHAIRLEEDVNWVHVDCNNISGKKIQYFKI